MFYMSNRRALKQAIIDILSPLLYAILKCILKSLKPLFVMENESVKEQLKRLEFHPALCAHPSILFGRRESFEEHNSIFALKSKVAYLKKCIRLCLLKDEAGRQIMKELGIVEYYGNGVDFWFEEAHSPIIPYTIPNGNCQVNRLAIYTALTGDYDNVQEVLYKEDGVDYILFTNNPNLKSKTWKVVLVDSELDNVLLSREIKMLPHKYLGTEYDASIYIDANAVIYGELSQLVNYLHDGKTFAVSRHRERSMVSEELDTLVAMNRISADVATNQYQQYISEGFVDNMPLLECGLLVRKHSDKKLQHLMALWFCEFANKIRRDQISLLPCIQKLNFDNFAIMDGWVWHNQYFRIQRHK